MAYKEQDWQAILTPFLRGIEGDNPLVSSFDDLGWLEDEQQLDPFTTQFDTEVRRLTGVNTPSETRKTLSSSIDTAVKARESFSLPTAATRGDAIADRIAASRGIDPGTPKGVGKAIDLAKTMLGTPYVFGTAGPNTFDCSGFTKWVYSRAFGVALPHLSTAQASGLNKVSRQDLQPGDLVFFSYGRLGPGVVDHVEMYIGDGKMIGTANTSEDLDIDEVDWSNFVQGGRPDALMNAGPAADSGQGAAVKGEVTRPVSKTRRVPVDQGNIALAPMALADGPPAFAAVMDSIFTPDTVPALVTEKGLKKTFRGSDGSVNKQLYQGFIDAGRPDLARMVGTKDWYTWLRAESGYDPYRVSQPYDGVRNYGLFQFRGHDWQQQYIEGGEWTADAYTQAKLVAKYFGHLTPKRIHEYAAQIRAGDYHGWG